MAKTKKKGKDDEVVINLDSMGVPIAILISGVLIAAVIFFVSRGDTPVTIDNAQDTTGQVGQEEVAAQDTGFASLEGAAVLGNPETATVAVVEYSDYMCGFCRRHAEETFPSIQQNYIDTGKILYVFKEFPLSSPGQLGYSIAEGGVCVLNLSDSETFFDYHKGAFDLGSEDDIIAFAQDLGIDGDEMSACLADGRYRDDIDAKAQEGRDAGVTGTPGFIVGRINDGGAVEGGLIAGALPYQNFADAIDALLD